MHADWAAPAPAGSGARNTRLWIVGGAAAAVVLLVAGLAFKLRDQGPQGLAKLGQTPPAEQQPQSGKIVERADRPAGPLAPQQPAVGQQPSAASQPPIPVAHRAALLLDAPDTPEKVKTFIGSVVWRLDSVPTGAGRPLGTAIHADVDIPEAKVRMSLDMQKNLDELLPASHTINVNFTILPGSELPGVKQIVRLQMRRDTLRTASRSPYFRADHRYRLSDRAGARRSRGPEHGPPEEPGVGRSAARALERPDRQIQPGERPVRRARIIADAVALEQQK